MVFCCDFIFNGRFVSFVCISNFHLFSTAVTAQPTPLTIEQIASAVAQKLNINEISLTTAVKYYDYLKATQVIIVSRDAADFNIDLIKTYTPLINNIKEFFHCPATNKSEHDIQLWWNGLDWSFWDKKMKGRKFTTFCEDTHSHPLENNRKPDCSHIAIGCVKSMYTVVVLNDLKPREGMFNADDKGKVLDLSKAFYEAQGPMRSGGLTSYLCDGDKIIFFIYQKEYVLESVPMDLRGIGGRWLLSLLTTDIERLGYRLPNIEWEGNKLEIKAFLGHGQFNNAFLGAEGMVIRQTKDKSKVTGREIEVHKHVADAFSKAGRRQHIVRILGVSDCGTALIEQPSCRSIATPIYSYFLCREQLHQVITIGAELKRAECVHLDLRPSNFLLDEAIVVLSDFGSAFLPSVPKSIPTFLSGTTKYGSPGMLQHLTNKVPHVPCFTDDYHSIIRVIYISVVRGAYEQLHDIDNMDGDGIAAFWCAALDRPLWKDCLSEEAVEKCDYMKFRILVDSCACNAKAGKK